MKQRFLCWLLGHRHPHHVERGWFKLDAPANERGRSMRGACSRCGVEVWAADDESSDLSTESERS